MLYGLRSQSVIQGNRHSGVSITGQSGHHPAGTVLPVDTDMGLLARWNAYLDQTTSKVVCLLQHFTVLEELIGTFPFLTATLTKTRTIIYGRD